MGEAKDILLRPISSAEAGEIIKSAHYSGKVVQNSQLHIGVYYRNKLEGALQFGPSLDKRKIQGLVKDTGWNEFIELNRMAFTDALPRNSESRALSIAMRLLRKYAPQIKWVVTFADATQCGDGTIYRAAGFVLTGINFNSSAWLLPNGESVRENTVRQSGYTSWLRPYMGVAEFDRLRAGGSSSSRVFERLRELGAVKLSGAQLRYIYFIDPTCREKLTVKELPYSDILRLGAGMYKGKPRGTGETDNAPGTNPETGGASPTAPLSDNAQPID